jgi:shikimate dehydrogenase
MRASVGLIGHPVAHSISPSFQQAAFDALNIDARYEARDVSPQDLAAEIAALREDHVLGANVTIPYKEKAASHIDRLHQTARVVGAINTIVNVNGELEGYNTDVSGFQAALTGAGIDPEAAHICIWGAGGAARAVAWALIWRDVGALSIVNRTPARAGRLRLDLAAHPSDVRLRAHAINAPAALDALHACDIVVHCTSIGLRGSDTDDQLPFDVGALRPEAAVIDLVANPIETPLVQAARAAGHKALGGLPMLVHQGASSFELWTRRAPPLKAMFAAAEAAMNEPASASTPEGTS